jgi:hypothetical protein
MWNPRVGAIAPRIDCERRAEGGLPRPFGSVKVLKVHSDPALRQALATNLSWLTDRAFKTSRQLQQMLASPGVLWIDQ